MERQPWGSQKQPFGMPFGWSGSWSQGWQHLLNPIRKEREPSRRCLLGEINAGGHCPGRMKFAEVAKILSSRKWHPVLMTTSRRSPADFATIGSLLGVPPFEVISNGDSMEAAHSGILFGDTQQPDACLISLKFQSWVGVKAQSGNFLRSLWVGRPGTPSFSFDRMSGPGPVVQRHPRAPERSGRPARPGLPAGSSPGGGSPFFFFF